MDEVMDCIENILPEISKTQLSLIEAKLEELGIESIENLMYLNTEDLTDIIKTVPARKLIAAIKRKFETSGNDSRSSSENNKERTNTNRLENSPMSSATSNNTSIETDLTTSYEESQDESLTQPDSNWARFFAIPWHLFPKSFMDDLNNKRRPTDSLRRQVIRILCTSIQETCMKPTARDIQLIAGSFVDQFKTSLADIINKKQIGSGYASVASQITERLHNLNRKPQKSVSATSTSKDENGKSTKYGCSSNWSVQISEEEEKIMIEKNNWLKDEFPKSKKDTEKVLMLFQETYALQRKLINNNSNITQIKNEFPFLFTREFIGYHFRKLTDVDLENYVSCKNKKFALLHFFRQEDNTIIRKAISEIDFHVKEDGVNNYIKLIGILQLLLIYFKEEELLEFYPVSTDTKTVEAIKRKDGAPIIAVIGNLYTAQLFHIVIEDNVISSVNNLDDAVCIMFALYYILNLQYHSKASLTLEFIQRVLIGINPQESSLSKTKKRKKSEKVHSKVLRLANYLDEVDQSY